MLHHDLFSCKILDYIELRIFGSSRNRFSSNGDGVISIFHHFVLLVKKVGLSKMCRLMVCSITGVTQKIGINVLCLTDHLVRGRERCRVRFQSVRLCLSSGTEIY